MSDQTPPLSVVAKIRKLLAMANDGRGNENEMAVAASMAAALMAEWNLEAAQLAADSGRQDEVVRTRAGGERSAAWPWQVNLMKVLSELNFCHHWVETVRSARRVGGTMRWRPRHFLLGRHENVETTQFVYDYLVTTLDALYPEGEFGDRKSLSAKSWFNGATMRVCQRLVTERRNAERASASRAAPSDGRALVTITSYAEEESWANDDALYNLKPGDTRRRVLEGRARLRELVANPPPPSDPVMESSSETPAERAKREAREARESRRFWDRQVRHEKAAEAKIDQRALRMGAETGDRVALRPVVRLDQE